MAEGILGDRADRRSGKESTRKQERKISVKEASFSAELIQSPDTLEVYTN